MSNYEKSGSLDGAIDQAVREMMRVDSRAGLRHRVARAITAPAPRTRGFRFGAAAIATTLVLMASVLLLRPSGPAAPVPAPPVAATRPAPPAPSVAGLPAVAAAAPERTVNDASTPVRSQRRSLPTPESIFGPQGNRVVAASIPPTPVEGAAAETWFEMPSNPAAPSALAPILLEPIEVAPLAIEPLFVAATAPRR